MHGVVRRPDGSPAANASVVISNSDGAIGFNVTDAHRQLHAGSHSARAVPIDAFEAANAGHGAATGQIFVAGQNVPVGHHRGRARRRHRPRGRGGHAGAAQRLAGLVQPADPFRPIDQPDDDEQRRRRILVPRRRGRRLHPVGAEPGRPGTGAGPGRDHSARPGGGCAARRDRFRGRRSDGSKASCRTPTAPRPATRRSASGSCEPAALTVTAAADGTFAIDNQPLGRTLIVATPQTGVESGSAIATHRVRRRRRQGASRAGRHQPDHRHRAVQRRPGRRARACRCWASRSSSARLRRRQRSVLVPGRLGEIVHDHGVGGAVVHDKGVVSDRLNPGESKARADRARADRQPERPRAPREQRQARPSASPPKSSSPASISSPKSDADGTFAFATLPLGTYTLALQDPIGTGLARKVRARWPVSSDLGDITLDAAAPVVSEMVAGAVGDGRARRTRRSAWSCPSRSIPHGQRHERHAVGCRRRRSRAGVVRPTATRR